MTLAQTRALAPLLTKVGEMLKIFSPQEVDLDHYAPAVHLDYREWRAILEEFGTP